MKATRTIKVWEESYRRLKVLAAQNGETLLALIDRLSDVTQECARLRAAIIAYRTAVRNCNGIADAEQALFAELGEE